MLTKVYFIKATSDLNIIKKAIEEAESKGATMMNFETSGDKVWQFEWINFYKKLSVDEIKNIEIKKLESRLKKLKNES